MTETEARGYIRQLTSNHRGFDAQGEPVEWIDECHIATDSFRWPAIQKLSRETISNPGETLREGAHPGISLVEIYLTEPLPDMNRFRGIFAVDDLGIWFGDQDATIMYHVAQQRVIPWRYIKGLVLHQRTIGQGVVPGHVVRQVPTI